MGTDAVLFGTDVPISFNDFRIAAVLLGTQYGFPR